MTELILQVLKVDANKVSELAYTTKLFIKIFVGTRMRITGALVTLHLYSLCSSLHTLFPQVWVSVDAKEKKFYFSADSDSQLTKGLAALLVRGLSGNSAEDILSISPSFVSMLGLQQTLTPSRTNGFVNMLELMQAKTKEMQRRIEQN